MSALLQLMKTDAPLALYPFDETSGTNVADHSGNARHATITGAGYTRGARTLLPGQTNRATDLSTAYALTPSLPVGGLTAVTTEAWFILDAFQGTNGHIISDLFSRELTTSGSTLVLRTGSDGTAPTASRMGYGGNNNTGGLFYSEGPNSTIVAGNLYHVVGCWSAGSDAEVWVNGALVSTAIVSTGITGTTGTGLTGAYRMGGNEGYPLRRLDGALGYCALYASKLTPAKIKARYEAGTRGGVSY